MQDITQVFQAMPEWLQRFALWAIQDRQRHFDIMTHVMFLDGMSEAEPFINEQGHLCIPDFHAMVASAVYLRDVAQAAGFMEMAQYCEQTRQMAQARLQEAEIMVRNLRAARV